MAIDPRSIMQLDPNMLQRLGNPTGGQLTQLGQMYQQNQQNQLANRVALQEAAQAKQKMKILQDEARREQAIDEAQKAYSLSGAYLDAVKDDPNLALNPKRYEQWMVSNAKGLPKSVINRFRGVMPTDIVSIHDKSKRFLQAKGLLDETSVEAYSDFMDIPGQPNFVGQYDLTSGKLVNVKRKEEGSGVTQNVYSGSNPYMKRMAEDFFTEKEKVPTALKSLRNLEVMEGLIDEGMITGSMAGIQETVGNFLKKVGVWDDKKGLLENTQSYYSATAKETANIIQEFGAGTGLSDADREYALKAAGGEISMTEESLKNIIAINRIATINTLSNWNQTVDLQPDEMLHNKDRFKVDFPKKYQSMVDEYDKEWGYVGRKNRPVEDNGDENDKVFVDW